MTTSWEFAEQNPTISQGHAAKLLRDHGWKYVDSPTMWHLDGTPVANSSFIDTLGDHETYRTQDVLDWLGY